MEYFTQHAYPAEPVKTPTRLPSVDHEVIVSLEEVHFALDHVDTAPRTHEIIRYERMPTNTHVQERIKCASIVIITQASILPEFLVTAPYLKCIITPTAGTNHLSMVLEDCKRRGIKVLNCAGSTSPAAAEHALSLYFAARRSTVLMQNMMRTKEYKGMNAWEFYGNASSMMKMTNKQPPCSIEEEVVGIIGYGHIGKRLETLCTALGMKVLIAERKVGIQPRDVVNELKARTPFNEVMSAATVFFVCCASSRTSRSLIDAAEFSAMRPEAIIVNVSRAGVIDTKALIKTLREGRISGAATDVFDIEPASTDQHSALLSEDTKKLNLTISPHVGYYSTKTVQTQNEMVKERIRRFVGGDVSEFEVPD